LRVVAEVVVVVTAYALVQSAVLPYLAWIVSKGSSKAARTSCSEIDASILQALKQARGVTYDSEMFRIALRRLSRMEKSGDGAVVSEPSPHSPLHQSPDLTSWVAKSGKSAEVLNITESHSRTVPCLSLSGVWLSYVGLLPVEGYLGMRAVAERLGPGMSTAA
jgi:hypothetical protein